MRRVARERGGFVKGHENQRQTTPDLLRLLGRHFVEPVRWYQLLVHYFFSEIFSKFFGGTIGTFGYR